MAITKKVEVLPYNKDWKNAFNNEHVELLKIFGDKVIFHHIGSTSIEGLCAKPIIDILAEAEELEIYEQHTHQLEQKGYIAKGEFGIPGRRYFSKPKNGEIEDLPVHLHAFQKGSHEITRHLLFRDYLRAHPELAKQYGQVKQEAAKKFPTDIQSYMKEKDSIIKEFERKALIWGAE
ncbi:GrpB family protein [Cytobacillus sp. FJAT-54145]|uniref:GrpB family protein n=1 Tax=Cytobacillus spartinae TaxID=3299023 RepID=A0ABW6KEH5_9BACI